MLIIELNLLGCSCEHYVLTASDGDLRGRRNRSHGVPGSLVFMVTLKVVSCFSFSCFFSTGGKGDVLQVVIPKAVASSLLSHCARTHYGGIIKLSHKWLAS